MALGPHRPHNRSLELQQPPQSDDQAICREPLKNTGLAQEASGVNEGLVFGC
jgi:hypothetical protein